MRPPESVKSILDNTDHPAESLGACSIGCTTKSKPYKIAITLKRNEHVKPTPTIKTSRAFISSFVYFCLATAATAYLVCCLGYCAGRFVFYALAINAYTIGTCC